MPTAYIGIGSNSGDRRKNIDKAIGILGNFESVMVRKISSIYETKPVGGPTQGDYLNGVIEVTTELSPYELLKRLNDIESSLGRVRTERNGPREIDLDILIYDDLSINDGVLVIPHPRIAEREFVLQGLKEIAPELRMFQEGNLR